MRHCMWEEGQGQFERDSPIRGTAMVMSLAALVSTTLGRVPLRSR